MKIKDIKILRKDFLSALILFVVGILIFILITENDFKNSIRISFVTSFSVFIWNTFWFNYYKLKKVKRNSITD